MEQVASLPIPGYPGYFVTKDGKVYKGDALLKPLVSKPRASRVKLRNEKGELVKIAIAKLVATVFVPNPNNHNKIIFKDRNKENNHHTNIAWVSESQYISFNIHGVEYQELFSLPEKKPKAEVYIDPERVPIDGYPNFFISPKGTIYRGNRIVKPVIKKGRSIKAKIWVHLNGKRKYSWPGLATLIASHFIPNPKGHQYIIFKDRNNRNCVRENIAWVDGETFAWYSGITKNCKGRGKIVLEREEAIKRCSDVYLKEYYKTLDESWLHHCWQEIEKRVTHFYWNLYRSELYLYFIDRAKRFSIIKDPLGLLLGYIKGLRAKLRKEISPDIPYALLVTTDESLREISFDRE